MYDKLAQTGFPSNQRLTVYQLLQRELVLCRHSANEHDQF